MRGSLVQLCLLAFIPWVHVWQYCTRIFHSAIISSETLYIDGGETRYLQGLNNVTAITIRDLLFVDLSKSWNNTDAATYVVSELLTLDQNSLQWSNTSSLDSNRYGTAVDGFMSLIESVGGQGILVSLGGGLAHPAGQGISILTSDNANGSFYNSMKYVSIHDVAHNEWYIQQTTGDIPKWRMSGCSVVVPTQDQSSFST